MAARPLGNSRNVEISKSPNTVIATVLGIGVAVITNTCGGKFPFARSASRCSTPNRCCSSIITNPRSAKSTPSVRSACVPITMPAEPFLISAKAFFRSALLSEPVNFEIRVALSLPPSIPALARSPINFEIDRKCCCAKTSVGANNAACPPLSTTVRAARSATIVFPDPTSPCNKRCIGWSASISL